MESFAARVAAVTSRRTGAAACGAAGKAMAHSHQIDTDDHAIPAAVRRFFRHRLMELTGLVLLACTGVLAASLASWNITDPSFNNAVDGAPRNWLGLPGAIISDELTQRLGLGVLVVVIVPVVWAVSLLAHRGITRPFRRFLAWITAILATAGFFALMPHPQSWALGSGLGGTFGDILTHAAVPALAVIFKSFFAKIAAGFIFVLAALTFTASAAGITGDDIVELSATFGETAQDFMARTFGALTHLGFTLRGWMRRRFPMSHDGQDRTAQHTTELDESETVRESWVARFTGHARQFWRARARRNRTNKDAAPIIWGGNKIEPRLVAHEPASFRDPLPAHEPADSDAEPSPSSPSRIGRKAGPVRQGKRISRDIAPALPLEAGSRYQLPPLTLLAEPKKPARSSGPSEDMLEQNARMLEGVLEDFGVRGEIIHVRPGPVVTLYELEPAPGIKSSRVIGLADDIARSMSAVSARVAVVPGRNVIGIELPNTQRETVYLRELLASQAYEKTSQSLPLALGKNIGGEPILADLARMPHLLIAGTTGSGKSVGINTMILSLLYRLEPDQCKLIMIDPKMLELSSYEGIPHLLSPVVTDPRKAVVALKWAVREMEDRYRKMSKLGVRNIDGYNSRTEEALRKGEIVTRTVQTGFDADTGEPVFEQEEMDLSPLPYIVVIIDEMADLMMVAGKEIEGAVQRLAQMARAAGIHVIMATQRPSVDVITGTIKANFPTRISFQVTSKIDSRTILGEQGAEQLLGQGDMLYMAGGGRISRLVADGEVEKVVDFLKAQGTPDYVDAVTEESEDEPYMLPGAGGASDEDSGNDLYDRAVAVVLRDKKVSTSYVQRRLQIGYNRAASLIERMENEGLISAPNHAGKRDILAGNPDAGDV